MTVLVSASLTLSNFAIAYNDQEQKQSGSFTEKGTRQSETALTDQKPTWVEPQAESSVQIQPEYQEYTQETTLEDEPANYYDEIPLSTELQADLFEFSDSYGVDPALILAMIETESSFQTDVVSSAGCYGLMQLNPSSFGSGLSPSENLEAGIAHISGLINKYGDTHMALVAYNCGEAGADRNYFSNGEYTSSYSRKVVDRMANWQSVISQ